VDWSLLSCGRGGHVTYAPDEPDLREQLTAPAGEGETWRCLRCGTFVPGPPGASGPADAAPQVRRGKEVRSAFILRVFAVERLLRAVVLGAAAFGIWRFSLDRGSLQAEFDHALPDVRRLYEDLGFNFQHSALIGLVQHALHLNPNTLRLLALGLAVYAVVEVIEAVGLWLLHRWGEYFALVATSVFLPYEIYDLAGKVTALRVLTFLVNLALVAYLVVSKRLLGVRGGRRAYDEQRREGSIMEQAHEAATAQKDLSPVRGMPDAPADAGPKEPARPKDAGLAGAPASAEPPTDEPGAAEPPADEPAEDEPASAEPGEDEPADWVSR
jgi:uncharacterized membrane protein (DUF2068 family)